MNEAETTQDYRVTLVPLHNLTDIESDWQTLAKQAEANCFLSWLWIKSWLQCIELQVNVAHVYYHDALVAMGLFTASDKKIFKLNDIKAAYLHQAGHPYLDDIWVEYNGLVAIPEHKCQAQLACYRFLLSEHTSYDALHLSGVVKADIESLTFKEDYYHSTEWASPTYRVDLKALRSSGEKIYLSTISRNSRYQIKKAMQSAASHSAVAFEKAQTRDKAMTYFDACAQWHIERWGNTATGSGFNNPHFMTFHKTLIQQLFDLDQIHIWRVSVQNQSVVYLYNIIDKKTAFFYLCAIDYQQTILSKPGLVAHSLVIQWYLDNGYDTYDLMGGDAQYKRSLAKRGPDLIGIKLMRKSLTAGIETLGRKLKRKISSDS